MTANAAPAARCSEVALTPSGPPQSLHPDEHERRRAENAPSAANCSTSLWAKSTLDSGMNSPGSRCSKSWPRARTPPHNQPGPRRSADARSPARARRARETTARAWRGRGRAPVEVPREEQHAQRAREHRAQERASPSPGQARVQQCYPTAPAARLSRPPLIGSPPWPALAMRRWRGEACASPTRRCWRPARDMGASGARKAAAQLGLPKLPGERNSRVAGNPSVSQRSPAACESTKSAQTAPEEG